MGQGSYCIKPEAVLYQTILRECENQIEYIFERVPDGLDYTSNYYFRRSQTITDKGHVSEDTLTHLAENGIRLV